MNCELHNDPDDEPRSLRYPNVRKRRRLLLETSEHMQPLREYVSKLRKRGKGYVPDFDPRDGGIEARALFLSEKPGPKTDPANGGSGFISRNNDDSTAEAACRFRQEAGLPRKLTVSWNVIPWWNGAVKIRSGELQDGVECVKELIELLPNLRAVMFVGKKAAKARKLLANTDLELFESAHPSPRVRAGHPELWKAIPQKWAELRPVLGLPDRP